MQIQAFQFGNSSLFAHLALTCHPCTCVLWYSLSLHDHIEAAFNYLWSNSLSCREHHCQPGDTHTTRSADAMTCSWDKLRSTGGIQLLSQRSESELMNFAGPAAGC